MNVNPEEPFNASEPRCWIQSRDVAKRLGIKTQTLAKWRLMGKGPQGWRRVASNVVLYPASGVRDYQEEKGLVYTKAN
jgi:hypothetical protein